MKDKKVKTNKDFVVYENLFKFKNIKFLVNSQKDLVVCDAFSFYEGQIKDIDNLISKLKDKFKKSKPKVGKLVDGAIVHQWYLDSVIIQLQNDTKQEKETEYSNGKEIVKYTCYVRLSVYNIKRIDTDIRKYLKNKSDFVLFEKEHFVK